MSLRIIKQGTEYIIADASDNSSGSAVTVIDNLNSSSSVDALSANQGRVLNNNLTQFKNSVGSLINLTTQDKTSIVNAINELVSEIGQTPSNVYTKLEVDNLISDVESGIASDLTNYYTKTQIDETVGDLENKISAIPKFNILVVQTLPTTDISTTTVYLVPSDNPKTGNIFEEYIYVNNQWELLGSQKIDLSNYYTKTEVDNLVAHKINSLDDTVTNIISLTQAEYNALKSNGELVNGTIYNITDGNGEHTNINVIDGVTSTSGQDALSANQGRILNNTIQSIKTDIGNEFSTSYTYKLGELCIYNNNLYKCINDSYIASGTFNVSDWQQVNLSELVQGLTPKFYEAYTTTVSGISYFGIDYKGFLYDELPEEGSLIYVHFPTTQLVDDAYLSPRGSSTFKYPIKTSTNTTFTMNQLSDEYLTLLYTNEMFYIYTGIGLVENIDVVS